LEIYAEEARRRYEATLPKPGQKGFQPASAPQNFGEHNRHQRETASLIAKNIGLGSRTQWDKLEYIARHEPGLLGEGKLLEEIYAEEARRRSLANLKQFRGEKTREAIAKGIGLGSGRQAGVSSRKFSGGEPSPAGGGEGSRWGLGL
jgi:uncharacterized membrane protein YgcG